MATPVVWYRKKRWWALAGTAAAVCIAVAVGLQPFVTWLVRHQLSKLKGYDVTFDTAHFRPTHLDVALTKLKVVKPQAGGDQHPLLYARRTLIGVRGRELLHGHVVANVNVEHAKVHLIAAKAKQQRQLEEAPDLAKRLEELLPMRADRVQITDSELTFIDRTSPDEPRIWIHDAEGTVENIATRAALSRGQPTIIALASKLQKTGQLSAFITADPLANGIWFSGEARAAGLDVRDFHDLVASKTGVALDQGTLDVFMEFQCKANHIQGGVKPILKNPHVVQAKGGVDNWFKAALADTALELFKGNVNGQKAVATTLPIQGNITQPQAQLWPTVFGVVRNAFVEGVTESYDRLPPPQAGKNESILQQAVESLDKSKQAPKAQPAGKKP
jgi:hypothetical protein